MKNFTILIACFISVTSIIAQVSDVEKLALEDLYHSTNGTEWHTQWDLNAPVSSWKGVKIENNTVIGIELGFNNLKGTLPSSLENLTNLKYLKIFFNQLSGEIPAELGNLKYLEVLDFTNNFLTGHLPSSLGELSSLKELLLSSNNLLGSIPATLGKLQNLKSLSVFDNNLTGEIPASIAQLKNLDKLMITANNFDSNIPLSEEIVTKYGSEPMFEKVNPQDIKGTVIATSLLDDEE